MTMLQLRDAIRDASKSHQPEELHRLVGEYCVQMARYYRDGGQGCILQADGEVCAQSWQPEPLCWHCSGGGDPAPLIQAILGKEDDLAKHKTIDATTPGEVGMELTPGKATQETTIEDEGEKIFDQAQAALDKFAAGLKTGAYSAIDPVQQLLAEAKKQSEQEANAFQEEEQELASSSPPWVVVRMSGIDHCRRKEAAKIQQGWLDAAKKLLVDAPRYGFSIRDRLNSPTAKIFSGYCFPPIDPIEESPRDPAWDVASAIGSAAEPWVVGWLRQEEYLVEHTLDDQFELEMVHPTVQNLMYRGHPDGKISKGANSALLEIKCLSHGRWEKWFKSGVKVAQPDYYAQTQGYMKVWGLDRVRFEVIDRSTAQIDLNSGKIDLSQAQRYTEWVKFDPVFADTLFARWESVAPIIQAGNLPEPDNDGLVKECDFCEIRKWCPAWQATHR